MMRRVRAPSARCTLRAADRGSLPRTAEVAQAFHDGFIARHMALVQIAGSASAGDHAGASEARAAAFGGQADCCNRHED